MNTAQTSLVPKGVILWIDDQLKAIRTYSRNLTPHLGEAWSFLPKEPPQDRAETLTWIADDQVCMILIDQRLSVQVPRCTYTGMELAQFLHATLPFIPIFIVTNYETDPDVVLGQKDVLQVISKSEMSDDLKVVTIANRIRHLAGLYLQKRTASEEELSVISENIAEGRGSGDEARRADEIARSLWGATGEQFALSNQRVHLLAQGDELVAEFESLKSELEALLATKRGTK